MNFKITIPLEAEEIIFSPKPRSRRAWSPAYSGGRRGEDKRRLPLEQPKRVEGKDNF